MSSPARAEPPRPDTDLVVILVRDAIAALNQANWTGNYTVLRDYASPNFAAVNDPARLAQIFQALREEKVNLAPVLVLPPTFTQADMIDNGKRLQVRGFFDSRPRRVNFYAIFEPVEDRWRIFGLSVSTAAVQPANAAPAANAAQAPNPTPAPAPQAAPATSPEPTRSVEPTRSIVPTRSTLPTFEPEVQPEPEPQPEPAAEALPVPAAEPEPVPAAEAVTEVEPDPEPLAETRTEPVAIPVPLSRPIR